MANKTTSEEIQLALIDIDGTVLVRVSKQVTDVWQNFYVTFADLSSYIGGGGAVAWGEITGTLTDQTDLATALGTKEPTIAAGTTSQYWRGDKTWQTLNKAAVGLSNVDNTSDANKPVSTAQATADATVLSTAEAYADSLIILNNFNGAGAPTATDDATDGYSVGSLWFDTTATPLVISMCTDPTATAAVWVVVNGPAGSDREIQFNNLGNFGTRSDFSLDANKVLQIPNVVESQSLHDSGFDSVTKQQILSGTATWAPTATNLNNLSGSITLSGAKYTKVGSVYNCVVLATNVDAIAAATGTSFTVDLPVTITGATQSDIIGVASSGTQSAWISCDGAGLALIQWTTTVIVGETWSLSFSFEAN